MEEPHLSDLSEPHLRVSKRVSISKRLRADGYVDAYNIMNGSAILMEWLGTEDAAAPQLRRAQFGPNAAVYLFKSILGNVELMLRNNVIHGDLSPFNILFHEGGIRIIDFPQAIDARTNHNAFPLLLRDLEHVYEFFQPHGVRADPLRIAQSLWARYLRAEL